jgi:hypothetical protein
LVHRCWCLYREMLFLKGDFALCKNKGGGGK